MFKLLGDESAKRRQIELVPINPDVLRTRLAAGWEVFAFRNSARRLRHHALNVSYKPLPLTDGVLPDFLLRLADGMVVAIAVPSRYAEQFVASGGASFTAIGGPHELPPTAKSSLAVTGVRGNTDGAVVRSGSAAIDLHIAAGRETGDSGVGGASGIQIQSREGEAAIRQGSRDIVRTAEGAAVAVWTPKAGSPTPSSCRREMLFGCRFRQGRCPCTHCAAYGRASGCRKRAGPTSPGRCARAASWCECRPGARWSSTPSMTGP